MKIGVVGRELLVYCIHFIYKKSNQDVTLFTRTAKQADELNITGVTCIREGKRETVFPPVLPIESMLDQQLDYIFIAVKQYHITDILPFVRGKSSVVFLQNGMSHLHAMQKIENENIAVGIVEHGAKKKKDIPFIIQG